MKDKIITELSAINRVGLPSLLDFLRENEGTPRGYFTAPASTKYHLSVPGGLAKHSVGVFEQLTDINLRHRLGYHQDSIAIVALLHDVCKVNFYNEETKRVRSASGDWSDAKVYGVNDLEPLGHGEKSVIIISRYIKLTEDEALAIRWHMSSWDAVSDSDKRNLGRAMDKCKLLKALILADQTSTWLGE